MTGNTKPKATKAEMQKRITEVYQMLCEGFTYSDICRHVRDKYKIKNDRTIDIYIQKATDTVNKDFHQDIERIREIANARLNTIFKLQFQREQYRDAVYTQQQMNKINALEVVNQKTEHTINMTDDKKEKIKEIFANDIIQ